MDNLRKFEFNKDDINLVIFNSDWEFFYSQNSPCLDWEIMKLKCGKVGKGHANRIVIAYVREYAKYCKYQGVR